MIVAARRSWPVNAGLLGVSVALGAGLYLAPLATGAAAVATAAVVVGAAVPRFLERVFVGGLVALLVGYAFFSKSFAYLGVAPVFIGEVVLAVGVLYLLVDLRGAQALRSPIAWIWIAVAVWGAARTAPYLPTHGVDALRDAVIWGYGLFAILVATIALRNDRWIEVPSRFGRLAPLYLLWAPIGVSLALLYGSRVPTVPGSDVGLLTLKAGDLGVHFGGIAAFLLLGLRELSRTERDGPRPSEPLRRVALWTLWGATVLVLAVASRAAMLAAIVPVLVVLAVSPGRAARRIVATCVASAGLFLALLAFDVSIEIRNGRTLSAAYMADNVASIFGAGPSGALQGTRSWRLEWWGEIVDYTVFGPHFWGGKGFGVNLADSDGFQVSHDGALRSPHNGHLTMLARGGVPGFALWIVLQGAFAVALLRAHRASRRAGADGMSRLLLWVLAYWAAFMTNAAFDVYIEGPQGGIWFWSVFGYGIALLLAHRGANRAALHASMEAT